MLRASRLPLFPVILARERLTRSGRSRKSERMVMDEPTAVTEYDAAGLNVLMPVHQPNALALSNLLPIGGTLLDLGCGSGRLLSLLARGRPDIRVVGLDLSEPMLEAGERMLRDAGVADRVELREADITACDPEIPDRLDLVSCNWALHHLPDEDILDRCLGAIHRARQRTGCGIYIFDFARLRNARSWPAMVSLAAAGPGAAFRRDAIASERAAFSFEELTDHLRRAGLGELEHARAGPLGEYQLHWVAGRSFALAGCWQGTPPPLHTQTVTRLFLRSFPDALTHGRPLARA